MLVRRKINATIYVTIQHGKVTVQIAADLLKIKAKKHSALPVREYFSTQSLGK